MRRKRLLGNIWTHVAALNPIHRTLSWRPPCLEGHPIPVFLGRARLAPRHHESPLEDSALREPHQGYESRAAAPARPTWPPGSAAIMLVSLIGGNVLLAFFGISYGDARRPRRRGDRLPDVFGGNSPNKGADRAPRQGRLRLLPHRDAWHRRLRTIAVVIGFSTEIAELTDYVASERWLCVDRCSPSARRPASPLVRHALLRRDHEAPRAFGHWLGQAHGLSPHLHRRVVRGFRASEPSWRGADFSGSH